jgi:hypothetical protein
VRPNVVAPSLSAADLGRGAPVGQVPQYLRIAFFLWLALAALQVVAAVLAFASRDAAIDVARTANTGLTEEQLQTSVTTVLAFFSLIYVVFAVLLVLFAVKLRAGKGWARTALMILGAIVFLFEARFDPIGVVTGLLIVGGIVLMNLQPSSDFIKAQRAA